MIRFLFPICFVLSLSLHAASVNDKDFGTAVAEVTSIYDGDTFRANIAGYPEIIGERIGIRINGIDTPEMRGKCDLEKALARRAKEATVSILRNAKRVELRHMKRGKYFRIVADVFADGKSVAETLLEQELAVPYDGGRKVRDWCRP